MDYDDKVDLPPFQVGLDIEEKRPKLYSGGGVVGSPTDTYRFGKLAEDSFALVRCSCCPLA